MSQPVKLSDRLVLNARIVGELSERSIAGQIEFWARLGQAVESVLRADELLRIKKRGDAVDFAERLETVDSPAGRARVDAVLAAEPYPHFDIADGRPGYLVKIDADGTRTVGRFVNRKFRPAEDEDRARRPVRKSRR
jgi:hypothetical protein